MKSERKKTGVFCGSFDPIHTGHAMIANYAGQYCGLDEVWLMPSPLNPLKREHPPVADRLRLEMCRIVAGKCTGVRASDFEFGLPLPTYTYRTLCRLRETWPDRDFVLLIGSDNWLVFDRWRDYDKIIGEFGILIYPRPGYEIDRGILPESVRLLEDAPQALISSTFVREGLRRKKNMNFFLDSEVLEFIKKQGLYD